MDGRVAGVALLMRRIQISARSIERLILIGVAVLVIMTAPAILLIDHRFRGSKADLNLIRNAAAIFRQADSVNALTEDAVTQADTFALTGDTGSLKRHGDVLDALVAQMAQLRITVANDPAQVQHVAQLVALVNRVRSDLSTVIARRSANTPRAVPSEPSAAEDAAAAAAAIRLIVNDIENAERHRMAVARDALSHRITVSHSIVRIALVIVVVGCTVGGLLVIAYLRRQHKADAEMAAQTALLSATLENIDQGIVVVDRDLRILAWNRHFLELNGCPPALVYRGASYVDVLRNLATSNPSAVEENVSDVVARIRSGVPHRIERRRPNDVIVEISGNYTPDGLMVTTFSDVTDRKNVERRKTEFITTVSHELRTPLTSIIGSLALLTSSAAGSLPEIPKRLVTIAHSNAERLVRLVNEILDLEKIEAGQISFKSEPIRLRSLISDCIEANRAYGDRFNVRYILDPAADDGIVLSDPDRLMQVTTNLLSNAAKFSHPGGTVDVGIVRHGNALRLSVLDHGSGIPPAFHTHVFERFAQANRTKSRGVASTGLGLAICREIIERLGGQISFDSVYGEWTAFHVDLPLPEAGKIERAASSSTEGHADGEGRDATAGQAQRD